MARFATLAALAVVLLSGCGGLTVSLRTFGAANVDDLKAEETYKNAYAQAFQQLHIDMQGFAPSGSNPGPCNAGGQRQACYDLDVKAMDDMRAIISALNAIRIPPRYVEPDRLLKAALQQDIDGLDLRNQAIATLDQSLWEQHQTALQAAQQAISQACAAFPEDNRPLPPP